MAINEDDYITAQMQSDAESPKKVIPVFQNNKSRTKGMVNSHSNKRLPTDKEQSLMIEFGRMQNIIDSRGGIADRSLDRVKGASFFNGLRDVF